MRAERKSHSSKAQKLKFYFTKLRYRSDIAIALLFICVFFLIIGPLVQILYTSFTYQSNELRVVRGATVGEFIFCRYLRVFLPAGCQSLSSLTLF